MEHSDFVRHQNAMKAMDLFGAMVYVYQVLGIPMFNCERFKTDPKPGIDRFQFLHAANQAENLWSWLLRARPSYGRLYGTQPGYVYEAELMWCLAARLYTKSQELSRF